MQEIWIPSQFTDLPRPLQSEYTKIQIPNNCQFCNFKLNILYIGSSSEQGYFSKSCEHYKKWSEIWKKRLIEDIKSTKCDCGAEKANTTHSTWCSTNV